MIGGEYIPAAMIGPVIAPINANQQPLKKVRLFFVVYQLKGSFGSLIEGCGTNNMRPVACFTMPQLVKPLRNAPIVATIEQYFCSRCGMELFCNFLLGLLL
jgi:hypothetical protein